ncbi:hypothetical protein Ahy_B09g098541 isoform E [Arachis hypogaea]|uniref:Uncharacterized protein n=1 Tax=Arachis hypogaea TaxID=3818 RepID=A0A444XS55_ARAHY|nr:hypothetical protein Ahy_B09g098541 isoform A [Arachis hypogaea]RYQ92337.1 hypothetical protein Ahy_B09g098541 isoform E [Arachis hypogaea]
MALGSGLRDLRGSYSFDDFPPTMKKTMPWSDEDDDSSGDESPASHSDSDNDNEASGKKSKVMVSLASRITDIWANYDDLHSGKSGKLKSAAIDFEALRRHGYKGGPSVLRIPPPKEVDTKQDWSWSTGKDKRDNKETEESSKKEDWKRRELKKRAKGKVCEFDGVVVG